MIKHEENEIDPFEEARKEETKRLIEESMLNMSIDDEDVVIEAEVVEQEPVERIPPALAEKRALIAESKEALENLKVNITGKHCERFDRVLTELPDREFMRIYPKVLEFFVPKAQHRGGGGGVINNVQININRGNTIEE